MFLLFQKKVASPQPLKGTTERDSCEAEIQALECEIERLKSSKTCTPEQETDIIRKELNVLKKYCAKLSTIQAENIQLKRQMGSLSQNGKAGKSGNIVVSKDKPIEESETLEQIKKLKDSSISVEEVQSKLDNLRDDSFVDDCDEKNDKSALKSRIAELEFQLSLHKDTIQERDRLKARVQQLEAELQKYGNLPGEVEVLRKRSLMLDEIIVERDSLHTRLNHLQGIEKQVADLKKKASRVDELEKQLKDLQNNQKEIQNLKAERDMLRMKAADYTNAEQEIERLRYRAKEAEVLRIERDRMKVRLDELAAVEVEFMQLLEKTKCLETIKAEREMYKSKYEELLGLECECDVLRTQIDRAKAVCIEKDVLEDRLQECECLIAEQENEINKLLSHIDRLSQGHEEQQVILHFLLIQPVESITYDCNSFDVLIYISVS